MKNELDCDICLDLLPLYLDKKLHEETEKEVKNHLLTCKCCHDIYKDMCLELPKDVEEDSKKKKRKNLPKIFLLSYIALISLISILFVFLIFISF